MVGCSRGDWTSNLKHVSESAKVILVCTAVVATFMAVHCHTAVYGCLMDCSVVDVRLVYIWKLVGTAIVGYG